MVFLELFLGGLGLDFDGGEGVVVDADGDGGSAEAGGLGGIRSTHRKSISDREDGEAELELLGDELHVEREGGVACVVESALGGVDDKAGGIATVGAVGKAAGVDGIDHLGTSARQFHPATVVHGDRIARALLAEPLGDLPVGNDCGTGLLGHGDGIGDVIHMAVGNQNDIRFDAFYIDLGGKWIGGDEGIEEKACAAAFDKKAGVAEVSEFHSGFRKTYLADACQMKCGIAHSGGLTANPAGLTTEFTENTEDV